MFYIIDIQHSPMPTTTAYTDMYSNSYGFIPISLPKLQGILKGVIFSLPMPPTNISFSIQMLPSSICSEYWFNRSHYNPLNKINISPTTPPFRFAGHTISPLYGVRLAATIIYINGHPHTLKLFAYFLQSTPIPFLLGLVDQHRLSFEICLREGHSSHLKISTWQK